MTESVPETGSDTDAAKDTSAAQGPDRASGDRADLLVHLESLHELQIALSQEERDDEILRIGTAAAVEILGADCGLAIVRSDDGAATLRFGWREGAQLAKHEVEILIRNLNPALQSVRNGTAHRVVLAAEPNVGEVEIEGEPSGALQSRGLGSVLVLGLGKGGGRLGELVFGCREPVPFSPDRLLLAEILAMQLAVQIERARRTNEARDATARSHRDVETATRPLRERNQELESLSAVAAAVAPSFELERQLDQILRRAAEVTGHEGGAIYLVDTDADGGDRLKLVQCLDARERSSPAAAEGLRAGEGLAGRVWERDEIVALADLRADPDAAAREDLVNAGFHGILMAPLRARGRVIGVLELVSREERFYLDDEQQLAQAIAAQVGLMIQNSRLLSDLMRHSLDLEGRAEQNANELNRKSLQSGAVHGVIRSVTSQGDQEATLVSALESVLDLLGAEVGIVHLLDRDTGSIIQAARCGTPQETEVLETLLRDTPAVRRAIDSRECQVCERPGGECSPGESPDGVAPVQVLVVVPLLSLGRVVGVLSVGSTEVLDLGEEERDCLASLSSVIGMAVDLRTHGTHAVIDNAGAHLLGTGVVPPGLVQAQKLASIGTLAGGIAHDFNNIVGAVLGYATHIKALVTKDNPIYRHASIIEQQSLRGCDLTKQLLAFARGGERRRQPLDVNAIVAETATLLSRTVGTDIAVDVQASPDLPAIEADPVQLQQIVLNLAVNAKDAMPQGGRLTIETRVAHLDQRFVASAPGLRPGDYVEVIVGDTGLGMTPDIMERMFEPFFTTKSDGQGSGLGLAVVYGVVKGHAGHVTVDSSPGIGTTVRLYFPASGRSAVPVEIRGDEALGDVIAADKPPPVIPLVPEREDGRDRRRGRDPEPSGSTESKSDSDEAADGRVDVGRVPVAPARPGRKSGRPARAAHAPVSIPVSEAGDAGSEAAEGLDPDRHPGSKEDDGRVRILVVDDEEALRELARDILESRGYEVLLAKDGVEALTIYRKHWGRIAMVLLDMMMPRLGGLETFRRMRGMDRQLHVLLCSGYSHNEQAQLAIREGAVGLLPKPYTMTELLAWVDKVKRRAAEPSKTAARPDPPRTKS